MNTSLISETRFIAAQERSLDAFTIMESVRDNSDRIVDFRWTYANPAAGRILKHAPDELVGSRLLQLLPGNQQQSELFSRYVRVVETGQPHDIELEYTADNIHGWFRNMTVKLDDGVAIWFSDITLRKRSEEQRRALQELAAALSRTLTVADVGETMIQHGMRAVGAAAGSAVILSDNGKTLELVRAVGFPHCAGQDFRTFPVENYCAPLLIAVHQKKPIWFASPEEQDNCISSDWPTSPMSYKACVAIPLIVNDQAIGGLGLSFPAPRPFDELDRQFMLTLADYCAQAMERARLAERARETAAQEERQRLARDLHDAVSQTLFSAMTIAEVIPRIWQRDSQRAWELLEQVVRLNRGAHAEMRALLLEMRPEAILKTNLSGLLKQLVDAANSRKPIIINLTTDGDDEPLPPESHMALYRIAQEGINNVVKHSQAAHLTVQLNQRKGEARLTISDDGCGFDTGQLSGGMGLNTMRERAAAAGIELELCSAPGKGTTITVMWKQVWNK